MIINYFDEKNKSAQRPRTLDCYICGREYGTRSLEIHIKTCEKKWDNEQKKLPAKKRRPCPEAPRGFKNMIRAAQGQKPVGGGGGDEEVDVEQYNRDLMNAGGAVGTSGNNPFVNANQAIA